MRIKLILSFFIILISLLIFWILILSNQKTEDIYFTVNSGENISDVLTRLDDQKLISNYNKAIKLADEKELILYPNTYVLNKKMSDQEVIEILNNPQSNSDDIEMLIVPEGSKLIDIAQEIELKSNGKYSQTEILNKWSDKQYLNQLIDDYIILTNEILNPSIKYPLEGYMYPATYPINESMSIDDITRMMLDQMESKLIDYKLVGDLTYHQYLTLASIVERETLHVEDKAIVAQVFINRLECDMLIQSDITVLYAEQRNGPQVLYSDLEYDDPYNTYIYKGLPPGPIASPSIESIDAVFNPNSNNYLYFFADQDSGEIYYSETYEEHQEVAEKNAWIF